MSNDGEVNEIINYLIENNMLDSYHEINVRIIVDSSGSSSIIGSLNISNSSNIDSQSNQEFDEEIFNDEQTINIPFCNSSEEYVSSGLTDGNLLTYYNRDISLRLKCPSMLISYNGKSNHHRHLIKKKRNVHSYCLKLNKCENTITKKLPFICKFESSKLYNSKAYNRFVGDFYPDTLRNYQQDPKMSFVIYSLLAVAHGLDQVHKKVKLNLLTLFD